MYILIRVKHVIILLSFDLVLLSLSKPDLNGSTFVLGIDGFLVYTSKIKKDFLYRAHYQLLAHKPSDGNLCQMADQKLYTYMMFLVQALLSLEILLLYSKFLEDKNELRYYYVNLNTVKPVTHLWTKRS
jgi:hypothetical protein